MGNLRNRMTQVVVTVHVACSASAAGTLRKALPLLGSTERVIGLPRQPERRTYRPGWIRRLGRRGASPHCGT